MLLQHPAQHGFAAADFTGDLDDAFTLSDGVDQALQHRAAFTAGKEKPRVRGDAERGFFQAEKFVVHGPGQASLVYVCMRLYSVVRLMPRILAAADRLPWVRLSAAST